MTTPLVRTGPKGAGEFRATSWDDALDLVAARIRRAQAEAGPASVVPWLYSSSAAALQTVLPARLFRLIGASEVDDTICAATFGKAWDEMFPNMLSADPLDVVHARLGRRLGLEPGRQQHALPAAGPARGSRRARSSWSSTLAAPRWRSAPTCT